MFGESLFSTHQILVSASLMYDNQCLSPNIAKWPQRKGVILPLAKTTGLEMQTYKSMCMHMLTHSIYSNLGIGTSFVLAFFFLDFFPFAVVVFFFSPLFCFLFVGWFLIPKKNLCFNLDFYFWICLFHKTFPKS